MPSFYQRAGDVLFSSDPTLRARSSMAMLAVLLMAGSAGVLLWLAHAGYGAAGPMRLWAGAAVSGLVLMAAMVRSGMTAAWR